MPSKKKQIQNGNIIGFQDIESIIYNNIDNSLRVVIQLIGSDNHVVTITKTVDTVNIQTQLDALITAIDNEV